MASDSSVVTLIKKQFLCCTPLKKFNFTTIDNNIALSFDIDLQKEIIRNTINNDLVKQYPIKISYQKAFLKLLIGKLEMSCTDVYDDIYNAYCELISYSNEETKHYLHYLIESEGNSYCITVQENINIISEGTTGLCCWQAALALSEWCMENKNEIDGKTVLELGCGIGVTGLSIVKSCSPKRYIFSDCHDSVLNRVCTNLELNLLPHGKSKCVQTLPSNRLKLQMNYEDINVQVVELNWGDTEEYAKENMVLPDIIIAADILYDQSSFHDLITGLKMFLNMKCSCAIIAATVRNEDTIKEFLDVLEGENLTYKECTVSKEPISIQSFDAPVRILKISKSNKTK